MNITYYHKVQELIKSLSLYKSSPEYTIELEWWNGAYLSQVLFGQDHFTCILIWKCKNLLKIKFELKGQTE